MINSLFSYTDHNFNILYQSVFALEMSFRLTYPENYVSTTKNNTSSNMYIFCIAEKYFWTLDYLEMINLRILSYDVTPWGVTVGINHPVGFLLKEDSKWKCLLWTTLLYSHVDSFQGLFEQASLKEPFPIQAVSSITELAGLCFVESQEPVIHIGKLMMDLLCIAYWVHQIIHIQLFHKPYVTALKLIMSEHIMLLL